VAFVMMKLLLVVLEEGVGTRVFFGLVQLEQELTYAELGA